MVYVLIVSVLIAGTWELYFGVTTSYSVNSVAKNTPRCTSTCTEITCSMPDSANRASNVSKMASDIGSCLYVCRQRIFQDDVTGGGNETKMAQSWGHKRHPGIQTPAICDMYILLNIERNEAAHGRDMSVRPTTK